MTDGQRLRQLRERNNIPRWLLADWMSISASTVQKLEEDYRDLRPAEIDEIAHIFRITADEFKNETGGKA